MPGTITTQILTRDALDMLIVALRNQGHTVLGPTQRGQAIIYDEIHSTNELPSGMTFKEAPASYRLAKRKDDALFGYAVGPYSWKRFLYPPSVQLFKAQKTERSFEATTENRAVFTTHQIQIEHETAAPVKEFPRYAFFGVRPCELAAIEIQDKIFCTGQSIDPYYKSVRDRAFIVAVNCTETGELCFCDSMKTGPKANRGFDLSLTEILNGKEHYFIVESGSDAGTAILKELPAKPATQEQLALADEKIQHAATTMGRTLDTTNIRKLLSDNFEHPRWETTANRCLSCANCTMVCPTCFCSTVEDITDLTGERAERWRVWDSCFTMDFSHIHGGSIRSSVQSRYRQWMTHKLANWIDQFGTSGCVGCGRCIAWCPVGIDITEEARVIRTSQQLPIAV